MDEKEVKHSVVFVTGISAMPKVADVVSDFSHSLEVNAICAEVDRPHVFTFVEKDALERAVEEYIQRKGLGDDDVSELRFWLKELLDGGSVGILESSS